MTRLMSLQPERRGVRQGDELGLAGNAGELTVAPVLRSLLDALAAARHEVPVDVALLGQRLTAEQHQASGADRTQHDLRTGLEHDEPVLAEAPGLPGDLDLSADDVNRPFDMLRIDAQARSIVQRHIGVEQIGVGARRCGAPMQ